jgi:hypothetical protein
MPEGEPSQSVDLDPKNVACNRSVAFQRDRTASTLLLFDLLWCAKPSLTGPK